MSELQTSTDTADAVVPARSWRLRSRTLEFGELPALMGILNVTPDSFSDGGLFVTPSQAVEQALRLEDEGADIIDIGGESTRPYSEAVALQEELKRITPVLEALSGRLQTPISIDTSKASVAQAAIDLGAQIINDVTGLTGDPAMLELAVSSGAGICAMHMQGNPRTMQDDPNYDDVVEDIISYLQQRDQALLASGVKAESICLDPGIGFGKTHEQNLELLENAERFLELNRPILIGHSRKGFVGKLIGDQAGNRTAGTVGLSLGLATKGIQILRVHDVRASRDALNCFKAMGCL